MRNLDECKAEIFRLGDKKIKQRKKRRMRTLSVCVPLCLCLVVFSATVLPTMLTAEDKNTKQPLTELEDESVGTTFYQYTQVEIIGFGGISLYRHVNEQAEVTYIAELFESFYSNNSGGTLNETGSPDYDAEKPSVPSPETPPNDGAENPNKPLYQKPPSFAIPETGRDGYLISFATEEGYKVEYILSGAVLRNEITGKTIILTGEQREELLSELTGGV